MLKQKISSFKVKKKKKNKNYAPAGDPGTHRQPKIQRKEVPKGCM